MNEAQTRTELVDALADLIAGLPDMRTGQVLAAVGELCADLHGRGLWDASDAELLESVWRFRADYEATMASVHDSGVAASEP